MAADTAWDDHWNERFKACAFRALFQPSPTLTDLYCRMLKKGRDAPATAAEGRLAHSSVGIHVRTGGWVGIVGERCRLVAGQRDKTDAPHPVAGDDRTWNPEHSEPTDEHMRFADCASGARRAVTEAKLTQGSGRAVDADRWHVASDYQKVVDDVRGEFPGYAVSIDALQEEEDAKE